MGSMHLPQKNVPPCSLGWAMRPSYFQWVPFGDPRFPAGVPLVFAGKADPGSLAYHDQIKALALKLGVADRIIWAGQLSPLQVAWCFRHASVFVMTSRAEACPNTVLEALSHGCISVSCDNDPMPEFFGEAALYYRSGDGSSLANRLIEALELPPSSARALSGRARERATGFTWDVCARRTIDELAQALEQKGYRP